AAIAGHTQLKALQVLVDAQPHCVVGDARLRLDLPPFAVFAQTPFGFCHWCTSPRWYGPIWESCKSSAAPGELWRERWRRATMRRARPHSWGETTMRLRVLCPALLVLPAVVCALPATAQEKKDLAAALRELGPVLDPKSEAGKQLPQMLARDLKARRDAVNKQDSEQWHALKSREDWEKFKRPRIEALRRSLGQSPGPPKDLKVRVTKTLDGEGFFIDNVVFENRPGLLVTANLYRPAQPADKMPGILICHSHHNPKTEGELQDMGMTWARQG